MQTMELKLKQASLDGRRRTAPMERRR